MVAAVQLVGIAVVCCREKPTELVGQARMKVFVLVRKMRKAGDVIGLAALKAANCMSHASELSEAVALYEPAVPAT